MSSYSPSSSGEDRASRADKSEETGVGVGVATGIEAGTQARVETGVELDRKAGVARLDENVETATEVHEEAGSDELNSLWQVVQVVEFDVIVRVDIVLKTEVTELPLDE